MASRRTKFRSLPSTDQSPRTHRMRRLPSLKRVRRVHKANKAPERNAGACPALFVSDVFSVIISIRLRVPGVAHLRRVGHRELDAQGIAAPVPPEQQIGVVSRVSVVFSVAIAHQRIEARRGPSLYRDPLFLAPQPARFRSLLPLPRLAPPAVEVLVKRPCHGAD